MKNIKEIKKYLNNKYEFQYNVVSTRPEYKIKAENIFQSLDNRKLDSLFIEVNEKESNVSKDNLLSLLTSDYSKSYNPIEIYFKKLPVLNGKENIEALTKTINTHDNSLFEWVFKKWLVAWVACMLEENTTNQQCIILSGNQGIGKSTWVEHLMPKELKPYYYAGKVKLDNNDTLGLISSKCLINLDELVNLTERGVGSLKELITKGTLDYRKVFAKLPENFMRRASFIGSINDSEFLYDLTGNRRFLSFEVLFFENKGRHSVNMDLVLSEVYQLYKNEFRYWFNEQEQNIIEENNKKFIVTSVEEETLLRQFSPTPLTKEQITEIKDRITCLPQFTGESKYSYDSRKEQYNEEIKNVGLPIYLTASQLYTRVLRPYRANKNDVPHFGKLLRKHNFIRVKRNGVYCYQVYDLKAD